LRYIRSLLESLGDSGGEQVIDLVGMVIRDLKPLGLPI
jgi:hypothetical protein